MTTTREHNVQIGTGKLVLDGILGLPPDRRGVVVFAHGSGSGRLSPRNNFVARRLQRDGLATLLLDLLTDEEADDRRKVFDMNLLAERLVLAKDWVEAEPQLQHLSIGYFGASTGAGAALQRRRGSRLTSRPSCHAADDRTWLNPICLQSRPRPC
jgi:dienelactone hydrolase